MAFVMQIQRTSPAASLRWIAVVPVGKVQVIELPCELLRGDTTRYARSELLTAGVRRARNPPLGIFAEAAGLSSFT